MNEPIFNARLSPKKDTVAEAVSELAKALTKTGLQIKGDKGEKGDKGDKGDKGERGEKGAQGLKGERGEKGAQGDKGPEGKPGLNGLDGLRGPIGAQGFKGDKGDKGDKGEKGDRGDKGDKGDKGDRGLGGLRGLPGAGLPRGGTTGQVPVKASNNDFDVTWQNQSGGGGGSADWGDIGGTLSDQTDLQTALNAKYDASNPSGYITAAGAPVQSVAGQTGTVTLAKGDVGLGNVDNTSDANKPVSTATQTALDGKQDTLVSATNIKTINTVSLLGSGDITIGGGGAAWGDITGTLSSQTDLQGELDAKVTDADVRGGAANLNARLGTISNFASPNAGGIVSGNFYDNAFQGTNAATLIGAANRIVLAPFYTSIPLAIDQLGLRVTSAGGTCKIVVYSTDSNGWPDELLLETGDIDTSSTGAAYVSASYTFLSGVQYWLGVRYSASVTIGAINVSSSVNLGLSSNNATAYYKSLLRNSVTYANGAPDPWAFVSSDLSTGTAPSIRFRAA
jgi:hypothetical protein